MVREKNMWVTCRIGRLETVGEGKIIKGNFKNEFIQDPMDTAV